MLKGGKKWCFYIIFLIQLKNVLSTKGFINFFIELGLAIQFHFIPFLLSQKSKKENTRLLVFIGLYNICK